MRVKSYLSIIMLALSFSSSVAIAADFDGTWNTKDHARQIRVKGNQAKNYIFNGRGNFTSNSVVSGNTLSFDIAGGKAHASMKLTGKNTAHGSWSGRGQHTAFDLTRQ
jgi:hypothetical protein